MQTKKPDFFNVTSMIDSYTVIVNSKGQHPG